MTFTNVKLILAREIRDQLRDRRTLFMIAVLPILLYPLLGLSLFQVSQFMQEQPTRVLVVGAKDLAGLPPLFEKQQFAGQLFSDPRGPKLLELHFTPNGPPMPGETPAEARADAYAQVQAGQFDAALCFPPDFASRLDAFRAAIRRRADKPAEGPSDKVPSPFGRGPGGEGGRRADHAPTLARSQTQRGHLSPAVRLEVPSPEIIYTTANDKSQIAFARLSDVLRRWTEQIGDDNLVQSGVPKIAMRPFFVESADVADADHREASMWSKVLPVLLLLWALTGAFYPAVDLCAGEKERGTLETLLCSPAQRSEIVLGKLATVMLFSVATAVLNLLSLGITGWMVVAQLPGFGLPPPVAIAALLMALVPISALFSGLCLALAALARSTKEGQYYLMPLLLVTMPLVILPMSPGVELNLGNSLIPITGVVLLLRSVLEGNYWQALQFAPAVMAVTFLACLLSIRWAVDQFNSESVLFRESERLDLGLWLRHLFRQRQPTPTVAAAACCGVLILVVHFFVSSSLTMSEGFGGFTRTVLITQLAVIGVPTLLMTILLSSSPRQTLLLRWPPWMTIPAAALLAVLLHPAANRLQSVVQQLYPVSESVRPVLEKMQEMLHRADFWPLVLVIALVPAICEELAFRGFILSGFRHLGHKWRAVIYSALLFGLTHGILQQSLIACLLGLVLGFLALQSGSILPGMVFHVVHNGLAVANGRVTPAMIPNWPLLRKLVAPADGGGCTFEWPLLVIASLGAVLLLGWLARLNCPQSPEEKLAEAIAQGDQAAAPLVPDRACL
jgi:sodium transport system permease protein